MKMMAHLFVNIRFIQAVVIRIRAFTTIRLMKIARSVLSICIMKILMAVQQFPMSLSKISKLIIKTSQMPQNNHEVVSSGNFFVIMGEEVFFKDER